MTDSTQNESTNDINDIFDNILLTEENLVSQGYQDGFDDGVKEGSSEGYHLGYHRGSEIGAELGYYFGFIELHLQQKEQTEKVSKSLNDLKAALESFPKTNVEDVDILGRANDIRMQFKKVCALLKIRGKYPENKDLTF